MPTNPFANRYKTTTIRTKAEVLDAIRQHRLEAHDTDDLEQFFDCAACGVLESRLKDALELGDDRASD